MTVLAVVLARAGSKGIPGKNLRKLSGTPIVEWSIRSAMASKQIEKVLLSSDGDEICTIGKRLGCEIHKRREEDSMDTTSSEQSLLAALNDYHESSEYTTIVLIQPTSPLTSPEDFDIAIKTFFEGNFDSMVTVVPSHSFTWNLRESKHPMPDYDPERRPRRQEMGDKFSENGAFYITNKDLLEDRKCRLGGRIGMYVMESHHSVEVDEEVDLQILQELANSMDLTPAPLKN